MTETMSPEGDHPLPEDDEEAAFRRAVENGHRKYGELFERLAKL